jgi:Protein of unknown function (DUF1302)
MKLVTPILALSAVLLLSVGTMVPAQEPSLHGFVRYQLAGRYNEQDIVRGAVTAETELNYRSDRADLFINPSFEYQPGSGLSVSLREAYIDLFLSAMDIRVGKQIVIWGKSDGVAITDIVSPKQLTNFLIPEFRELRLGVTAVKANYYVGPAMLEVIYLPLFTPSVLPQPDSIWAASLDTPITPTFVNPNPVPAGLADGEIYARIGLGGGSLDLEIASGYYWSNEPVPTVTKAFSSPGVLSGLTIRPEYYRQAMIGGSVSAAAGPLVLRGESAFFIPRRILTTEMADEDGYVERNYLQSLLGVDTALAGVDLSAQLMHQFLLDHDPALAQEEHTFIATFRARDSFINDTLTVDLLSYVGITDMDALVKLGVTYAFTDALDVSLEGNIFLGDSGQFGQYDNNDLVVMEAKYSY